MFLNYLNRSTIKYLSISASITALHAISISYNPVNLCVGIISGSMIASGVKNILNSKKKYGAYQLLTASALIISNIALNHLFHMHQQNFNVEKKAYDILKNESETIYFPWGVFSSKEIKNQIKNIICIATQNNNQCDIYLTTQGNQTFNQHKLFKLSNDFSARFLQEKIFENCGYIAYQVKEGMQLLNICIK
jgi:hypothetical protein